MPMTAQSLQSATWDRICRHLDGLGIGTTVAALHERGVFDFLGSQSRVSIREIQERCGGNPGYLQLALRLLAGQQWLRTSGDFGSDSLTCTLTQEGRCAVEFAPLYVKAASLLRELWPLNADDQLVEVKDLIKNHWGVKAQDLPAPLRRKILGHLDGHGIGPVMAHLASEQVFEDIEELSQRASSILPSALAMLEMQGWIRAEGQKVHATQAGVYAAACAKQYWYPIAYFNTLIQVPNLLFGKIAAASPSGREETHIDRELDVRFSGKVFSATCQQPLGEIVLGIFSHEDRPKAIVDTGCGDGSLLAWLYSSIVSQTSPGRPLVAIGIEPNLAARRVASDTLTAAQVPHILLDGDITEPEEIARQLRTLGYDAQNTLHVSKSVIHNRRYKAPSRPTESTLRSSNIFALPDGNAIQPGYLEQNLIEHFESWRPLTSRYGMVVIEAHTARVETVSACLGRSIATVVDALHGYSNQYLVEPEVFRAAAQRAGYQSRRQVELGVRTTGHVTLTIDHFVPV
jgi:hypothetical protein